MEISLRTGTTRILDTGRYAKVVPSRRVQVRKLSEMMLPKAQFVNTELTSFVSYG